jgi:hypothetical protein
VEKKVRIVAAKSFLRSGKTKTGFVQSINQVGLNILCVNVDTHGLGTRITSMDVGIHAVIARDMT